MHPFPLALLYRLAMGLMAVQNSEDLLKANRLSVLKMASWPGLPETHNNSNMMNLRVLMELRLRGVEQLGQVRLILEVQRANQCYFFEDGSE